MFQSAEKERLSHDAGKLLLRLTLGGLILFHGIAKIEHGVDSIADGVVSHGLPGAIAYLVYVGEVVAPILLILGVLTRAAALLVVINMIVAVAFAHTSQLLSISESGGYGPARRRPVQPRRPESLELTQSALTARGDVVKNRFPGDAQAPPVEATGDQQCFKSSTLSSSAGA